MMSKKQQIARANFKKAIKEAQALRKKNPKLTQSEALKKAFAANKNVGAVAKKDAPKKKDAKEAKYVKILGQEVKEGTKLYEKLVAQKKYFDDLRKSEIGAYKVVEKKETKLTKPKATYQVVRAKKGTFKGLKKIAGSKKINNLNLISGIEKFSNIQLDELNYLLNKINSLEDIKDMIEINIKNKKYSIEDIPKAKFQLKGYNDLIKSLKINFRNLKNKFK